MLKKIPSIIFYCTWFFTVGCNSGNKILKYEVFGDSSYRHDGSYMQDFVAMEKIFEKCGGKLFSNPTYIGLQLQGEGLVGSIVNKHEQNPHAPLNVVDNLFSMSRSTATNDWNCFDRLDQDVLKQPGKMIFYLELKRILEQFNKYQKLIDLVDTSQMTLNLGTAGYNSISATGILNDLQKTKDSSLIHFKEILLKPGNALLVQTAYVANIYYGFPFKRKLSEEDEEKLIREIRDSIPFRSVSFTVDTNPVPGSPTDNHYLKINVPAAYDILGQFVVFKEGGK